MPTVHTVSQGEDMFTIAVQFGFRDYRTIYDDPANASLREERPNPGVLHAGDQVSIPDREPRVEERPTDRRHTFHTLGVRRWLRLCVVGPFGKPCAGEPYTLVIDDRIVSRDRRTDGDGQLSEAIPMQARTGKVTVGDLSWDLDIGELNPLFGAPDGGISGAQARLVNLGYDPGPVDGRIGPRTGSALRRFQGDHGLPVSSQLDDPTRHALQKAHGC